jgi:Xaa-Pro aminopeptidase
LKSKIHFLSFIFILLTWQSELREAFCQTDAVFSPQELSRRRAAFVEQMPDSSVAVFFAASVKNRSNDVAYEYRQDSNFYYLAGITAPNSILLIVRNEPERSHETVLFVPRPHPFLSTWEGASISVDAAKEISGIEIVKTADEFDKELATRLAGKRNLFCTFQNELLQEPISGKRFFIGHQSKQTLEEKYPGLEIHSPAKMAASLRQIKSPAEIAVMRRAIDITCDALSEAMRGAEAGMYEYQLEAIIEFVFKKEGAEYPAFPSIVGSGPNSTILHHSSNRRKTVSGDLVVMDVGAEYRGYSADVTRTIPINGKFTAPQREIYEIVLRAQKAALALVKPGVLFREVHEAARKVVDAAGYGQYFTHATSHYLGLDTHDVGDRGPLESGMVITVEPGIYIREGAPTDRAYWNIGIRIEDDVLVTETGYEILSNNVPREIPAIEKLMKDDGRVIHSVKSGK